MIITDLDKMFEKWDEAIETDEEMIVFNKYKERMYEDISTLLTLYRERIFVLMLNYFYRGRLDEMQADIVMAQFLNASNNLYINKGEDERIAYHLANFIRFFWTDAELITIMQKVKQDKTGSFMFNKY